MKLNLDTVIPFLYRSVESGRKKLCLDSLLSCLIFRCDVVHKSQLSSVV